MKFLNGGPCRLTIYSNSSRPSHGKVRPNSVSVADITDDDSMKSFQRRMDLTGRRAFVTGGAGHIGRAVAECLLELGSTVALVDLDPSACEQRVCELSIQGRGRVVSSACDLGDEKAIRKVVQQIIADMGGLEVMVHCAAYVGTTAVPGWAVP